MVFCGPLFDMHPRYMHFKDLMMDFFRGQTVETMEIDGLQHVISISAGEQTHDPSSTKEDLPNILFRVYLIGSRKVAGSKVPRIELEEMGPRMDLKLGRWQEPNEEMMSMALKKPKPTIVLSSMCGADCRLKRRRMLRSIRWEINLVVFILVCRI
jgi:ribosome production factor 2